MAVGQRPAWLLLSCFFLNHRLDALTRLVTFPKQDILVFSDMPLFGLTLRDFEGADASLGLRKCHVCDKDAFGRSSVPRAAFFSVQAYGQYALKYKTQ